MAVVETPTSDATRDRLLDAAAAVFAEKGYDGAGVPEIARRAGLTTGAIYSRFTGKAELLRRPSSRTPPTSSTSSSPSTASRAGPPTSCARSAPTSSPRLSRRRPRGQRAAARGVRRRPPRPEVVAAAGDCSTTAPSVLAELVDEAKAPASSTPTSTPSRSCTSPTPSASASCCTRPSPCRTPTPSRGSRSSPVWSVAHVARRPRTTTVHTRGT